MEVSVFHKSCDGGALYAHCAGGAELLAAEAAHTFAALNEGFAVFYGDGARRAALHAMPAGSTTVGNNRL